MTLEGDARIIRRVARIVIVFTLRRGHGEHDGARPALLPVPWPHLTFVSARESGQPPFEVTRRDAARRVAGARNNLNRGAHEDRLTSSDTGVRNILR